MQINNYVSLNICFLVLFRGEDCYRIILQYKFTLCVIQDPYG